MEPIVEMDRISVWVDELSEAFAQLLGNFVAFVPNMLGAAVLILVGWLCARLLRAVTLRFVRNFNRLAERLLSARAATRVTPSERAVRLSADIAFWVVNLLFITAATRMLGLHQFSEWLNKLVAYLPTLVTGALIIGVGMLASTLVRDVTVAFVARTAPAHSHQAGAVAYGCTMALALVIGLNQIGIDVTLLVTVIAIVAAAALGGLALAFALGARDFIGNLIGAHYMREVYRPSQRLRIGDIEGKIEAFSPVSVTLATAQGRTTLPGRVFNEEIIVLVEDMPANA